MKSEIRQEQSITWAKQTTKQNEQCKHADTQSHKQAPATKARKAGTMHTRWSGKRHTTHHMSLCFPLSAQPKPSLWLPVTEPGAAWSKRSRETTPDRERLDQKKRECGADAGMQRPGEG